MSSSPAAPAAPLRASPQDAQFGQLLQEIAARIEGQGKSFADLDAALQAKLKAHADDIAKLSASVAAQQKENVERFGALVKQAGDPTFKGGFRSRENAENFGKFVAAVYRHDGAEMAKLQAAAILPTSGPQGGYLLVEQIIQDIMRDLDATGVFLTDCPPIGVNVLASGSKKGTSGPTVYYPEYGATATLSTPGFGENRFELRRHVAAIEIDNWMLDSQMAIALAEYVRTELVYALALATDTNWFMGTGVSANAMYTGLFKMATGLLSVTGDSGDDTFAEMIAKTTYYLAAVLGALPQWAHAAQPKWYMHHSVFFGFLGVRDSAGMPIANVFLAQQGLPYWLLGYPVRMLSVAPSTTAVSTCFALLAALGRACRTYRHNKAIEFAASDQLGEEKWLANLSAVKSDVPMDMKVRNGNGIVQLITHS